MVELEETLPLHTDVPEFLYHKTPEQTTDSTTAQTPSKLLDNGHHSTTTTTDTISESRDSQSRDQPTTELSIDLITRTLEEQKIPCSLCHENITSADGVRVGDKFYHRDCFSCGTCSRKFDPSDEIFVGKDNKILCSSCKTANPEEVKTVEICVYCKKPLESAAMVALGHKWHPECFVCVECEVALTGFFRDSGGVPYCEPCWLKNFAKICAICIEPIGEQVMTIEENHYHVECVKCSVCAKIFDNVLDILTIDADFWHVDCFKEAESESESEPGSMCSTSSALLGIYNQSLGFSANPGSSPPKSSSATSSNRKSRKISTVSFTPTSRPHNLQGNDMSSTVPVETPHRTIQEYDPILEKNSVSDSVPLIRPHSNCSTKKSTCCVIS